MRGFGIHKPASAARTRPKLQSVSPTGTNPGALEMLTFVPAGLPAGAPLVVVLHGCTQTAEGYNRGAGWSTLAVRHGFALLFPQQVRANNPNFCFNWFRPEDVTRGSGEVLSINQMIDQMVKAYGLDPMRVYVTGLSAGGALTAAMLATYPESFAGGAIISGLPYGAAASLQTALGAMRQPRGNSAAAWGDLVRAASPHRGRRPAVQIWHGGADSVVAPANFDALLLQWKDVLGLTAPPMLDQVDGARRQRWIGPAGDPALEAYFLPGGEHGTPLATSAPDLDGSVGAAGPFMLESGISSTWHLARSWGLLTQAARPRVAAA